MPAAAKFEIVLASLPDREREVAEIHCEGRFVALISQEGALGEFHVETPGLGLVESRVLRKIKTASFLEAIHQACERLKLSQV